MKTSFLSFSCIVGISLWLPWLSVAQSSNLTFTYNNSTFLLHGKPYQIIGGQMDAQRIPREYWRDRLAKARAMGLNTIFSYVFWNELEPQQGQWRSHEGNNDIASYFRIANEEGLNVVLRPGPYICGEREWGGFPYWLSQVPGMVIRTYNEPFLNASRAYLSRLANDLAGMTIEEGGPILMVQVENEYGSYGDNHNYTSALRDFLRTLFPRSVLYTNDGGVDWALDGGAVHGVLAETDGDTSGFKARDMYITDPTELGPLLDGEYYTYAPDQWGADNSHNSTQRDPQAVTQFVKDLDYVLGEQSASISFYMVHGGSNFGFSNGALWQNRTTAFTTSYDYSSPIDESGRTSPYYHTLRDTIAKYVANGSLPQVPADLPRMSIPEMDLKSATPLFDCLGTPTNSDSPLTMEAVGQGYGFVLYEHTANSSYHGILRPGDRPRDRILVYVNGQRKGVIDSQYQHPLDITVSLKPGDKLRLLVENLGRVDYHSRNVGSIAYANFLLEPQKGIVGDVIVGTSRLVGWATYSIPLESVSQDVNNRLMQQLPHGNHTAPIFYRAVFSVDPDNWSDDPIERDTFLAIPNGVKGQIFVNGFNLGRYWRVGPQQSLYLPGTVLQQDNNEIIVLELEPDLANGTMTAQGLSERQWFNKPDLDCLSCV